MNTPVLSVREIQEGDIGPLTEYWFTADGEFLRGMGADINKLPSREQWTGMLSEQLAQPYHKKKSYCITWLADGRPVGHSNVNKIVFGEEAFMHLHIWDAVIRKTGLGTDFVKMTLPWFFKNLQLKTLYCEPYALNPAPNKTMYKTGFEFVKQYITTPGSINFEQEVNLWKLSRRRFEEISAG